VAETRMRWSRPSWFGAPEGWGVAALLIFTLVAIVGYAVFGLHPQRVPEALLGFWRISYNFFAQAHILLGAGVLFWVLVLRAGLRWVPAALAVCLLSFLAEHLGTGTGLPFGEYEYTHLLGAKIGGRVPWVIPLSWFLMALPAWLMARATLPDAGQWAPRIIFAAALLTMWDLALDPAMSYQMPFYWRWADTGPYYGMPWINLAGWMATGVILMGAMEALGVRKWGAGLSSSWALAYYGATLLMPVGMLVVEGLWLALAVTVLACALAWGIHRKFSPAAGGARTLSGPSPLAAGEGA